MHGSKHQTPADSDWRVLVDWCVSRHQGVYPRRAVIGHSCCAPSAQVGSAATWAPLPPPFASSMLHAVCAASDAGVHVPCDAQQAPEAIVQTLTALTLAHTTQTPQYEAGGLASLAYLGSIHERGSLAHCLGCTRTAHCGRCGRECCLRGCHRWHAAFPLNPEAA